MIRKIYIYLTISGKYFVSFSSIFELITEVTLWFFLVLSLSDVAGDVAVFSIIQIISLVEHGRIIESIKFFAGFLYIIFDTITISVIDWTHCFWGGLSHDGLHLLMSLVTLMMMSLLMLLVNQGIGGDE